MTELCEIYYQNTGMVSSFRFPGGTGGRLGFYPQEERSEYCKLVQSTPEGLRRCLECDRDGLECARSKGGYHIYDCHAGLVDVAIPIGYQGEEIGAIYTGQVSLQEPSTKKLQALYAELAIPRVSFRRFTKAFSTVKVVDRNRLLFYVRLLDLMAHYIIKAESEIRLQRQIVLKDRELHRQELEKVHLEKTLKDLSISVLRNGHRNRGPAEATGANGAPSRLVVEKARAFIETHFGQDITLEDVARSVFLSPNYFSSLYKKVAGASFKSCLVNQRIEAARVLLSSTSLPIKEVVARSGFKDYNYFNKTFRAIAGVPPAAYRARHQEGQEGRARDPEDAPPVVPPAGIGA